jgi:hypothetical protein
MTDTIPHLALPPASITETARICRHADTLTVN